MHRLLYISTMRRLMPQVGLDGILAVSRRNNAAAGVTGLLVTGGARCLQVLEGPEDAVRATYARIRADDRHFAVVGLIDEPVAGRAFEGWSMGHQPGGAGGGDGTIADDVAALIAPIADPALRGYFAGFAEARAAA